MKRSPRGENQNRSRHPKAMTTIKTRSIRDSRTSRMPQDTANEIEAAMSDDSDPKDNDLDEDGLDDLDLAELERGSKAVEKKQEYQQYTSSGGRVVERKEFAQSRALGESETETKILKAIIIAIAILVPVLTIYWQMSGDDGGSRETDKTEDARSAK